MTEYEFKMSEQDINVVLSALNTRPHGEVRQTIDRLVSQIQGQGKKQEDKNNES